MAARADPAARERKDSYKKRALAEYRKLYSKTPNAVYKQRIKEMESAGKIIASII